jgi:hypothetical protein
MREPFLKARVAVVLYREPWGKTKWTRIEETAIKDRCLEVGWQSLQFVMLDKNNAHPKWLPNTHIRFNYEDYGLNQLIGAVKRAVQEQGGVLKQPDALSEARRVQREAEYIADRDAMMRDRAWIEGTVHRSLRETFNKVEELVAQANRDHGFNIVCRANGYQSCIMRSGFMSLGCGWRQPIFNNVGSDPYGDCYLRVAEFSGALLLPGEFAMHEPRVLKEHRIKVSVTENRELVWLDEKEQQIEAERLADRILMILMDLISRANQGRVERPPLL